MPQDLTVTDDKLTLVQVMAWCRQATSHYLSQCWLSPLSLYGIARPRWVNKNFNIMPNLSIMETTVACVNIWQRCLIVRYHEDSNLQSWQIKSLCHCEIWQVLLRQYCWNACSISWWWDISKHMHVMLFLDLVTWETRGHFNIDNPPQIHLKLNSAKSC